jgi:hypothetical protein
MNGQNPATAVKMNALLFQASPLVPEIINSTYWEPAAKAVTFSL